MPARVGRAVTWRIEMYRTWKLLPVVALCAVVVAGCGSPTPAAVIEPEIKPTVVSTAAPSLPAEALDTPAASGEVGPTPTLREGQEATDPATVNLASGKPTLVKFFAFW
jgi:hypothetical protein